MDEFIVAYAACSVLAFGVMNYVWYREFGPHQNVVGGRYSHLGWGDRYRNEMRQDRRFLMILSLVGPFSLIASLIHAFVSGNWGIMYRWPSDFYEDK